MDARAATGNGMRRLAPIMPLRTMGTAMTQLPRTTMPARERRRVSGRAGGGAGRGEGRGRRTDGVADAQAERDQARTRLPERRVERGGDPERELRARWERVSFADLLKHAPPRAGERQEDEGKEDAPRCRSPKCAEPGRWSGRGRHWCRRPRARATRPGAGASTRRAGAPRPRRPGWRGG